MANPTLAVLLRNGSHDTATIRYALKCNDIAVSYARTPIQIPISQQSPELIDLGFVRPSLTCTGTVDTIGEDITNVTAGVAGMASFAYLRTEVSATSGSGQWNDGGDGSSKIYYIPYKNVLEEAVATWIYLGGDTPLQVEIGDSKFPIDAYGGWVNPEDTTSRYRLASTSPDTPFNVQATGGSIYEVAIQQGRFSLNAAREDRYDFTLQFVITRRLDIA